MKLTQIKSTTIALFVSGLFVLLVGRYTANGGFQLAGGIVLLVAAVRAFNQARQKADRP